MFDLNGVLAGFCVGVFSGIFIAYKLAQRGKNNQQPIERPVMQYPDKKSVKAEIVSDQISFLNGQQVRK